jgi:hypothetical protein
MLGKKTLYRKELKVKSEAKHSVGKLEEVQRTPYFG